MFGFLVLDFWVLIPWFLILVFGLRFDFLVYLFGLDCLVWIPGFEFLRFDSFVWIPGFGFLCGCTWVVTRIPWIGFQGFGFLVLESWFWFPGCDFLVSDSSFGIANFEFMVSVSWVGWLGLDSLIWFPGFGLLIDFIWFYWFCFLELDLDSLILLIPWLYWFLALDSLVWITGFGFMF